MTTSQECKISFFSGAIPSIPDRSASIKQRKSNLEERRYTTEELEPAGSDKGREENEPAFGHQERVR